jgi:hypothetical protein
MYVFHVLDVIISKSHRIMQHRNTKIESMRVGTVFFVYNSVGFFRPCAYIILCDFFKSYACFVLSK